MVLPLQTGRLLLLNLALLGLLLGSFAPAASAQNPAYGLDSRVFPEPMQATSFLQFPDFEAGLKALDAEYPRFMDVRVIGESIGGYPIYFVEVTNEASPKPREEKLQIGYSASIHANEAAGREGMVRVIEDLTSGTGPLGDMQPLLDDVIINVWFPNPDSWASGDWFGVDAAEIQAAHVPSYARENLKGVDLNREFPNPGWIAPDHTPMSEPESRSVVQELRYSGRHENLVAGTDLHGMISSPNMMRTIIPNQDFDFHRMMVAVRFLQDLEQRVNTSPHFAEWHALAEGLCLLPEQQERLGLPSEEGHGHAAFAELPAAVQAAVLAADDGDRVWTVEETLAAGAAACGPATPAGDASDVHDEPFLWGARWDQIGYTDSGFTSDYLMLSPRSPTGGMGAVGTITEFAYSHIVPNNHYVAKLTDMHVAGVRETVRAQVEYALLREQPRLAGTGPTAYVTIDNRVTSANDPNAYKAEHGKGFDLADETTHFDFDQVPYDVSNLDFWSDLAKYSEDPIEPLAASAVSAEALAGYENLILTNEVVEHVDAALVKAWVEAGGNLLLTDEALRWFDQAGLTGGAAYEETYYLGHSDLADPSHPLLAGVDWNARATTEGPPIGYAIPNEYPQWHLKTAEVGKLDAQVAGTTAGDPSLGSVKLGRGQVHFIGSALPTPTQQNDHRYGLAPYGVTALTYTVFVNALGGSVEWVPMDGPFIPFYPDDPLYGAMKANERRPVDGPEGAIPAVGLVPLLGILAVGTLLLRRRRE